MTDLRAEAIRIGFWDEGHAQYAPCRAPYWQSGQTATDADWQERELTNPTREDAHIDDCD